MNSLLWTLVEKDTIIRNIGQSTEVTSAYIENEGIYIITFTVSNITYVFDFKHATPQQTPRITTWTFGNDREPASMIQTELYSGLLVGQKDGSIAGYEGYFDTDMSYVSNAVVFTNFSIINGILFGYLSVISLDSFCLSSNVLVIL